MPTVQLNRKAIEVTIPHRAPMLFLTSATFDTETGVATAVFKPRAWMCRGHFPGQPITPGMFTEEAVNQTLAVAAMYDTPPLTQILLRETGNGEHRLPTYPGQTLILTARVTSRREARGVLIIEGEGNAMLRDKVVYRVTGIKAALQQPKEGLA